MIGKTIKSLFCVAKPPTDYARYFIVNLNYIPQTYYRSIPHIKQHKQYVQQFQERRPVKVIGGEKFPMTGATFILNCEDKALAEQFAKDHIYVKQGLVSDYTINEFERMTSQDFSKLSQFYQYV